MTSIHPRGCGSCDQQLSLRFVGLPRPTPGSARSYIYHTVRATYLQHFSTKNLDRGHTSGKRSDGYRVSIGARRICSPVGKSPICSIWRGSVDKNPCFTYFSAQLGAYCKFQNTCHTNSAVVRKNRYVCTVRIIYIISFIRM